MGNGLLNNGAILKLRNDKIIDDISHRFDKVYFDSYKPNIDKFANKVFSDVHVHNLNNLSGLDKDFSLVFVSNHKSLADVILISKVFVKHDLDIPRFVGGNNLYVRGFTRPPLLFGLPDLKRSGLISIDRSRFNKENFSYVKCWHEYMTNFFQGGENLVFFPEGGRSYSGKMNEFKEGLFKLMLGNADNCTLLVPVFCGYDLVVDSVGFENNKSSKYSNSGVFKRFVTDFNLFRTHYKNKVFLRNDAEFNVGAPIKVKGKSLDELMSYSKNSFIKLSKVSCAEISAYALKGFKHDEVKTRDLINELEHLIKVTPIENMSSKLYNIRDDPEKVFDTGINNINSQKMSVNSGLSKINIVNNFLPVYYSNSASNFYDSLISK
jgi:1-acyl-sn-glycerol-3-phosphate acyltransferase